MNKFLGVKESMQAVSVKNRVTIITIIIILIIIVLLLLFYYYFVVFVFFVITLGSKDPEG